MYKDILFIIFDYLDNEDLEKIYKIYPNIVDDYIMRYKVKNNVTKYYFGVKKQYINLENKFNKYRDKVNEDLMGNAADDRVEICDKCGIMTKRYDMEFYFCENHDIINCKNCIFDGCLTEDYEYYCENCKEKFIKNYNLIICCVCKKYNYADYVDSDNEYEDDKYMCRECA